MWVNDKKPDISLSTDISGIYLQIQKNAYINVYILARYDYKCIFPELINALDDEKISVIKKGAQYQFITTERFIFNDCLHFSSPCTYESYLKQWGVTDEKSIFPYQYYSTIEQLEAATEFPPIEAFYSDLTERNVSENDYKKAKEEYDTNRNLPGNIFGVTYM